MLETFQLPFVQRGVYEILVLAVASGLVGTWIVLRGLAFYAHAVGTAAFPGLVLADGLGFAATLGAAGTGLLMALCVGWLSRRDAGDERYDSLTALVLVGALAAGVILASDVFRSQGNVETLLFGSLLLVDGGDIAFTAAIAAVAVVATLVLEQRWLIGGFDPANAPALGARSALPDAVLLALVALTAVAALSTLGALLATSLLVVPAATTRLLIDRLRAWQFATVALVAVEGVSGLWLSVEVNGPPGATIAVVSGGVFALVALGRALAAGRRLARVAVAGAALLLALTGIGCGSGGAPKAGTVGVVATTTVLADVGRNVGGANVDVTQILAPNVDPHGYEPRPRDVQDTARAKVVLTSGDNLDRWMGDVVKQSGTAATVIDVSRDLAARVPGEPGGADASRYDPHWWHDPANVEQAAATIRDTLSKADPAKRAAYAAGARAYIARLRRLDDGIRACIDRVPAPRRKLVTDHDAFSYFAAHYGITVVGAIIGSQTTQAQPSAGDVSRLVALVKHEGVKAIFPESSVNPELARAVADQTGATSDHTLYGDTLGPEGSPGATYLGMERANADAMVRGFTGGAERCTIPAL